ncbi:MAG: AraC family transcriptional regulator [Lachnospiraceae bacterium]
MRNSKKIIFEIDEKTNQETKHHGNSDLPIGIYYYHYSDHELGYSPWHWHKEAELYFVIEGDVKLTTTSGEYILHETEGCFINTNCLHSMAPYECEDVVFQSVVFDPFIISSSISMLFDEKYLFPLLKCKQIPSIIIDMNSPIHTFVYERISNIIFLSKKQEFGYEIFIRNYITEIWFQLIKLTKDQITQTPQSSDMDYSRIHVMLSYIHEHYSDDISLEDIAETSSISISECCRCFQRCLKQSPIDYLIDYRIHQAANLLLDTNKSISEICMETGFNNTSYFSNKFKKIVGTSPRDYRKKHLL